jgi:hypothetical protein
MRHDVKTRRGSSISLAVQLIENGSSPLMGIVSRILGRSTGGVVLGGKSSMTLFTFFFLLQIVRYQTLKHLQKRATSDAGLERSMLISTRSRTTWIVA